MEPLDRIHALRPLRVLADRSRDGTMPETLLWLEPHGTFRVTDNHGRLTAALLRQFDMLVIYGHGARPYSKSELDAVEGFVKRGGSLVLSASTSEFTYFSELPAEKLAANAVAGLFGFEFLEGAELVPDTVSLRTIKQASLDLTTAGKRIGLTVNGTTFGHPGPIAVPRGATVLLKERGSGLPVSALARVGKGRVLVHGDLTVFANTWGTWCASAYISYAAPTSRVESDPPPIRDVPRRTHRRGRFTIIDTTSTRRHVPRVLDLARGAYRVVTRELHPPKAPKRVVIHLVPGAGANSESSGTDVVVIWIGADLSDSAVVRAVTGVVAGNCLYGWWRYRRTLPILTSAMEHLLISVLERLGFTERAATRRKALLGGKRADLGRQYSQARTGRRISRIFLDLEEEFGAGSFRKLCRAMPKKDPFKPFRGQAWSGLDIMAFYMARALGAGAYDWLEEQGHSLRRLPLEEPGSEELEKAVDRALAARVGDRDLPLSERLLAAEDLAGLIRKKQDSLDRMARQARADSPTGLAAAIALSASRDERSGAFLRRRLGSEDPGLAAIAALELVRGCGDDTAADALVAPASMADSRFALLAGHALAGIGDDRAERFSFGNLPGCKIRREELGPLRLYAQIDGRDAAVVIAGPLWHAQGFGCGFSRYYVYWVHTDGQYRRLGLARTLLDASLKSSWARKCPATALHAMSDYFAHRLYRELGMPDSRMYFEYGKKVGSAVHEPPKGIRIGAPTLRETVTANRLLAKLSAEKDNPARHLSVWPGNWVARVARESKKIVGVIGVQDRGKIATIRDFGVADTFKDRKDSEGKVVVKGSDRREAVGLALLAAAENELSRRGTKNVSAQTWYEYGDAFHQGVLQRSGFKVSPDALVEQCTINDLPGYLEAIRLLLESRLAKLPKMKGWQGRIALRGDRLSAGLRIDRGRVRVESLRSRGPQVVVSGEDSAIERIVLGAASPSGEFVQARVRVDPCLTPDTKTLLETLFPRSGGPLDQPMP